MSAARQGMLLRSMARASSRHLGDVRRGGAHRGLDLGRGQGRLGQRGRPGPRRAQAVQEKSQVAAPDLRARAPGVLGHRREHELDERHVCGAQVGAHHAGGLGPGDQPGDHRLQPGPGLAHPVAPVSGEHEQLPEAAVGGQQRAGLLQERDQAAPLVRVGQGALGHCHQLVEALGEQRVGQGLLIGKTPVHGAHADPGAPRHVVQGRQLRTRPPVLPPSRPALTSRTRDGGTSSRSSRWPS